MGGIASPNPMMTPPVINPILAEIDAAHANLSPDAQAAIEKAHGIAAPGGIATSSGIAAPNVPATEPPPGGGIQAPAPTTVGAGITPPGAASPKLVKRDAIPGISEPAQDAAADNVSSAVIKPSAVPSLGSKMPETTPTPIGGKVSPELTRLTKPDTHQHNAQNTGTPGVNQIHNPWARVPLQILDALGRGLFPGVEMALPGTSGHHDVLVHQRQVEDTEERAAQDEAAKRELEAAQAQKDLHPGETKDWQEIAGGAIDPAHPELGPQPAFYNKNDPGQGVKFGNVSLGSKAGKEGGTVHEDKDGNYWVIHTDGTATQVAPKGTPLQGKGKEETGGTVHEDNEGNMWVVKGNGDAIPVKPKAEGTAPGAGPVPATTTAPPPAAMEGGAPPAAAPPSTGQLKGKPPAEHIDNAEEQFVKEYQSNPANVKNGVKPTIAQAQRAFKKNEQLPPQTDHGQNFIDPATNKLVRVEPGGAAPAGAITAAGENTLNTPTSLTRNASARAETMLDLDARIRTALNNPVLRKATGPIEGRLNEIQGQYGSLPHDLAELRNDLVSYGAFQAGLHPVRGVDALKYFDNVMGGLKQNPEELLGKLDSNKATAESVIKQGGGKSREDGGNIPTITKQSEFDALKPGEFYMNKGIRHQKPNAATQ